MTLPSLEQYELLLPLDEEREARSWLGHDRERTSGDELKLVFVEQFTGEFLYREDQRDHIVDEVERAQSLAHDLTLQTLAAGRLDGHFSIVHSFPLGEGLDALLASAEPDVRTGLRIIADVVEGVAHAHGEFDLSHGAIHPGVISVCWDGRTRLGRFGSESIVRRARHNWGRLDPRQLSYLSPEHCTNDRLDLDTDVFNLGTVFWELLTGRILFREEDEFERMRAICEEDAPPPTRFDDSVPPLLNSLILKALANDRSERFPHAPKMRSVLQGVLSRTEDPATPKQVAKLVRSADPDRYERWRGVERARRNGAVEEVVEHVAALFDVDPAQARLPEAEHPERTGDIAEAPGTSSSPSGDEGAAPDEPTQKKKLERLRAQKPDRPEEDIHDEKTQRHDESAHPVARDFEVDESAASDDGSFEDAFDSVSQSDWVEAAPEEASEESEPLAEDLVNDELEPVDGGVEIHSGDGAPRDDDSGGSAESRREGDDEPARAEAIFDEDPQTDGGDHGGEAEYAVESTQQIDALDPDDESDVPATDLSAPGPQDAVDSVSETTHNLDTEGSSEQTDTEADVPSDQAAPVGASEQRDESAGEDEVFATDQTVPESDEVSDVAPGARPGDSDRDEDEAGAGPAEASHDPDELGDELQTMSIDEWIEEEQEREPFEEPFPLEDVIEDRGESEQTRVRQPALEIISIGPEQPLEVSVVRGRQTWSHDGVPVRVESRGKKAIAHLEPPCSGWVARADNPGERKSLPSPPAELELKPGDVAELSDDEVTYRFRYFHPPESPNHIQRQNAGRTIGTYAVAAGLAVLFHVVAAFSIITIHESLGVTMTVEDDPQKEVFAKGKLKKFKKKKKKQKQPPPEPPEPREPADPAEQDAQVPEQVQQEINEKLEDKREAAEDKTKAEALASALENSDDSEESVSDAVRNIDAVDSPSGSTSDLELGGKPTGTEGGDVKMAAGSESGSELGDISDDISGEAGDLDARDKEQKVRGTVDSVASNASVQGELARSKISQVVNRFQGDIQGCYEQQLLKNPNLGGKITFEWTITRSGDVTGARQSTSSLGSAAVSNCILGVIRGMSFPKPKGGSVTVTYPFMFQSGG